MTRPRCGGVTNWMAGIKNTKSATIMEEMARKMGETDRIVRKMASINHITQKMAGASVVSCTMNPEVNNRPPIRQRVGCTP